MNIADDAFLRTATSNSIPMINIKYKDQSGLGFLDIPLILWEIKLEKIQEIKKQLKRDRVQYLQIFLQ